MDSLQIENKKRKIFLTFCESDSNNIYHTIVLSKHKASLKTGKKGKLKEVKLNKEQQIERFWALLNASKNGNATFNTKFLKGYYSVTSNDKKAKVLEIMSVAGEDSFVSYEVNTRDLEVLEESLKAL